MLYSKFLRDANIGYEECIVVKVQFKKPSKVTIYIKKGIYLEVLFFFLVFSSGIEFPTSSSNFFRDLLFIMSFLSIIVLNLFSR